MEMTNRVIEVRKTDLQTGPTLITGEFSEPGGAELFRLQLIAQNRGRSRDVPIFAACVGRKPFRLLPEVTYDLCETSWFDSLKYEDEDDYVYEIGNVIEHVILNTVAYCLDTEGTYFVIGKQTSPRGNTRTLVAREITAE
jgi:hypothetical protein